MKWSRAHNEDSKDNKKLRVRFILFTQSRRSLNRPYQRSVNVGTTPVKFGYVHRACVFQHPLPSFALICKGKRMERLLARGRIASGNNFDSNAAVPTRVAEAAEGQGEAGCPPALDAKLEQ
ncbi:uncharacterized protein EKO05_0008041 [Ascochyta rabiei]|uniref:uncharacterized protein n=1 Tax=Didymella rabiei TaxID=5454 RepID=UPI00220FC87D|nr:uncharacterized protein EKO05_0008041 [Ascochyta rabiei]UPX17701.1 hypothetical protein EKO05_0008041 [Ascochyta rabiei]